MREHGPLNRAGASPVRSDNKYRQARRKLVSRNNRPPAASRGQGRENMDIARLKAILAGTHPVTGAYSADHATAAAELHAKNVAAPEGHHPVTIDVLWQYLLGQIDGTGAAARGTIDLLREFAESGTIRGQTHASYIPARQSFARTIREAMHGAAGSTRFPMTAATKNLFTQISQSNLGDGTTGYVFSTAQLAAIRSLSESLVSVADIEGLGQVTAQSVKDARV